MKQNRRPGNVGGKPVAGHFPFSGGMPVTIYRLREKLQKVPGEIYGEINGQRSKGYRYSPFKIGEIKT